MKKRGGAVLSAQIFFNLFINGYVLHALRSSFLVCYVTDICSKENCWWLSLFACRDMVDLEVSFKLQNQWIQYQCHVMRTLIGIITSCVEPNTNHISISARQSIILRVTHASYPWEGDCQLRRHWMNLIAFLLHHLNCPNTCQAVIEKRIIARRQYTEPNYKRSTVPWLALGKSCFTTMICVRTTPCENTSCIFRFPLWCHVKTDSSKTAPVYISPPRKVSGIFIRQCRKAVSVNFQYYFKENYYSYSISLYF